MSITKETSNLVENLQQGDVPSGNYNEIEKAGSVNSGSIKGIGTAKIFSNHSNVVSKSADYTILDDDQENAFEVTTGATDKIITLPTLADNLGREFTLFKVDAGGAGNAIFKGEGAETIDGVNTQAVTNVTSSMTVKALSTQWRIK